MTSTTSSDRLNRLLRFLDQDSGNLALCKDAVCAALSADQRETARELIDSGLRAHAGDAELLALSGFTHLQSAQYDQACAALSAALAGKQDGIPA